MQAFGKMLGVSSQELRIRREELISSRHNKFVALLSATMPASEEFNCVKKHPFAFRKIPKN